MRDDVGCFLLKFSAQHVAAVCATLVEKGSLVTLELDVIVEGHLARFPFGCLSSIREITF